MKRAIIQYENTFLKELADGINLFLGSAFSIKAKDKERHNLPTGVQLRDELLAYFNLEKFANLALPRLIKIIQARERDELKRYLKNRFKVNELDARYFSLTKLPIKTIFTTNIDDVIYSIYEDSVDYYINDVTLHGPVYADKRSVNYIPLHGTVINDTFDYSFSTTEIATSFRSDPDKWHFLTEAMQKRATLFWGYGLEDAGTIEALSPTTIKGRTYKDIWITTRDSDSEAAEYFKAMNLKLVEADTDIMLDYFNNAKDNIKIETFESPAISVRKIFPKERIPLVSEVPVRSTLDFYLGAPPAWSDIYLGRLHKTKYFSEINNAINTGKDVLIVGLPAAGKSTLLMQVAAEYKYNGIKLITDSITISKARFILSTLKDERALVFVDNFSNDIHAVTELIGARNVQFVGCDREYYFETLTHKLNLKDCEIITVSGLEPNDVQDIFDKIPREIRKERFENPQVEDGVQPSLFELIETNIWKATIRDRFQAVLNELRKESKPLHDILIMCAYVHKCRTPVSFDMVWAFLGSNNTTEEEVRGYISRLGSLLQDYSPGQVLIDEDQDYFTPRSLTVSDAIIEQVPHKSLKDVIINFHKNITPLRICRYDIFKKWAYDASLMVKAFPIWLEGKRFYEESYALDSSPFLLQQGALYLAHKKQFKEAFSWIDEALIQTNRRIFSIKNSHAIILFKANINTNDYDPLVRKTLDESMSILDECYKHDKRKAYHALSYANQSLKYWNKYGDDKSKEYLVKAKKWLTDEMRKSPWVHAIPTVLRLVDNKLR